MRRNYGHTKTPRRHYHREVGGTVSIITTCRQLRVDPVETERSRIPGQGQSLVELPSRDHRLVRDARGEAVVKHRSELEPDAERE